MIGDEDEDALAHGAEGQGTEGQDAGGGEQEADLPAEHPGDEADDGEPEVEVTGKASRGEARIQRLANEAKAAREEAAAARREAEELRRQTWQQNAQVTEQQERERLALMTPDERAEYRIQQMERKFDQRSLEQQRATAAQMDKVAYDAKATINGTYAKFKDVIEQKFQEQLRQGRPVERELLLKLHLGELALEGANKAGGQRKQAQNRVASQRVASGSGKGDAAADRGKAGDSAEKRLSGVFI